MPKRTDIHSVLVIGSGPIVIGQGPEFDYSGTQACSALKAEGLRVCLVNSNPATIMTDPQIADATYVEPLTRDYLTAVIAKERPDALLPTLGGQTALNIAMELADAGILEQYGVEMIGANAAAISAGEDRQKFKDIVASLPTELGAESARSITATTMEQCLDAADALGYPVVVRPAYTLGGAGGGIAYDPEQLRAIAGAGLQASAINQVLLEESILGWKEYELELMRDRADNAVVVCTIENLDPMGVHTGDSITVAPAMTLTDKEQQRLRDIGIAVLRAVGVDTGGCNIQFAIHPQTGRVIVIEMNPRVSRSSALASKATGFPIAKIAAKLALGYTLDEIPNDITGSTPASFEPTLDYVVVKVPRFAFEKFRTADSTLTTRMQAVGEVMAIGRTFCEALQKALRSLEQPDVQFSWPVWQPSSGPDVEALLAQAARPTDGRLRTVQQALWAGASVAQVYQATGIDPWFLHQIQRLNALAASVRRCTGPTGGQLSAELLKQAKRLGFSDAALGALTHTSEQQIRALRWRHGLRPAFKTVDTCAGEFPATTPYCYSTYEDCSDITASQRRKVIILGSGPNRIGQGVEFDYSCVHAALALSEVGYETIMVNCNPETVSTDYDTSDRLYFEPVTCEDVLEIVHAEQAAGTLVAVLVQLGGQTPLRLAQALEDAGVPMAGTSPAAIFLAEDRGAFGALLRREGLPAPRFGTATTAEQALAIAREIGYPVLMRPSFVLGGRGMRVVTDDDQLRAYVSEAVSVSPAHPILIDRFLTSAMEIDVDALYDGHELYVGAILEHLEEAGVHSGDSSCVTPPVTLSRAELARVRASTQAIAAGLGVNGLLNVQFALSGDVLYVLEANPRASRTVPFVAKATSVPLAKAAARVMLGSSIADLRAEGLLPPTGDGGALPLHAPVAVKASVLPFTKFRTPSGAAVDILLGPEMRSTGEVMGIDTTFGTAFAKAETAAGITLPTKGRAFFSVTDHDKRAVIFPAKRLSDLGFDIWATEGTAEVLWRNGVPVTVVPRTLDEAADLTSRGASRGIPTATRTVVQRINAHELDLVVNTPTEGAAPGFGYEIRSAAIAAGIPILTTVQALAAAVQGIEALLGGQPTVRSLQEHATALHTWRHGEQPSQP